MAHTITLTTKFNLSFKVNKQSVKKIDQLLIDNNFDAEKWQQILTPFDNWVEYRVPCCIRKAEIIRQLLKNFTHYE